MVRTPFFIGSRLLPCLVALACGDGTGPGSGADPTGNRIAFIRLGNVWSMREDGSNHVRLTNDGNGPYDWASGPLSWSPDGTHVLASLTRDTPGGLVDRAVVVAGDGTGYRTVASTFNDFVGVGTWSPDGRWVTFSQGLEPHALSIGVFTASAYADGGRRLGGSELWFRDMAPAWSPQGDEIAFLSTRPVPEAPAYSWHLFVVDTAGSSTTQLVSAAIRGFRWSPDAQRLITVTDGASLEGPYYFSNLYMVDRSTETLTRISQQDNVDGLPDWSPDGTRLAFTSIRDGNVELYVMNADGSGVQRVTDHPADDVFGAWSPDGTRITFLTNRDGNSEIYSVNVDGTGLVNLTRSADQESSPAWR